MNKIRTFVKGIMDGIFSIPPFARSVNNVIGWWEVRRFFYNGVVGVWGFVSLLVFVVCDELPPYLTFEQKDWEPISIFVVGFLANVAYTGGWVAELIARQLWKDKAEAFGPIALSLGVIFSLSAVSLPGVFSFFAWLLRFFAQYFH